MLHILQIEELIILYIYTVLFFKKQYWSCLEAIDRSIFNITDLNSF
jgi:hypothetical protein